MKKKLAVLLAAALTLGMTACGASKGAGDTGKSEKSMVYACLLYTSPSPRDRG